MSISTSVISESPPLSIPAETIWNRRLRSSLERLRRVQFRGGSSYSDLRAILPAFALAAVWLYLVRWHPAFGLDFFLGSNETIRHVLMATSVVVLWNVWLSLSPYERRSVKKDTLAEVYRLISASAVCGIALFLWGLTGRSFEHGTVLAFVAILALIALSAAILSGFVIFAAFSPRVLRKRKALIVGTGPIAVRLKSNLSSQFPPVELVGCMDDEFVGTPEDRHSYVGPISGLAQLLKANPVELVLIGLPLRSKYDDIQRVIKICESVGVDCHYLQDIFETGKARLQTNAQTPQDFHVLSTLVFRRTQYIKRLMDVVGASILLLLFSPLMIASAIAVKFTSPGPIFFIQQRFGRHRKCFPMLKFRSMVVDAEHRQAALESQNEAQGPVFKLKADPRVTRVGAFLRKTSLDELPQLINVVRGEMSLVGPRPLPLRDVSRFEEPWLLRRFSVRPGLTCIWQVAGRSNTAFDSWIRQDLEYIDSWSLSLDVNILFRTIPAVLRGSGAV